MTSLSKSKAPGPKNKNRARWRAITLIAVYVAIIAHYAHWITAGTTLSPVEPSEAMQTLEGGRVNAGFIFFGLALIATAIFGRFFCGWGCHIVALQDLCTTWLGKVGIRPKPFRSRLLVFVPLLAALYMFAWPQVTRIWEGRPMPAWANHLQTEDFWESFPGPGIALLTFVVCGGVAVVVLGNKGFCTYGCPYGGFFYYLDRIAPGRIRVTDACDQCGHCTANCTSNVTVHKEVNLYKMVVDGGCMKCYDCIDHCPKGALYYGFGGIKVAKQDLKGKRSFSFTWPEEIFLAFTFLLCLYAFRGLLDQIPFLLSLGLAAVFTALFIQGLQLFYLPNLRVQRWQLKAAGKLAPAGINFAVVAAVCFVGVGYLAVHQFYIKQAFASLNKAELIYAGKMRATEAETVALAKDAKSNFEKGMSMVPLPVARFSAKLGTIEVFLGDDAAAEQRFLEAIRADHNQISAITGLARLYNRTHQYAEAAQLCQRWIELEPKNIRAHYELGTAYASLSNPEAEKAFRKVIEIDPKHADGYNNLGMQLGRQSRLDDAKKFVDKAIELSPSNPRFLHNRALLDAESNDYPAAFARLERVNKIAPDFLPSFAVRAQLGLQLGKFFEAKEAAEVVLKVEKFNPDMARLWAQACVSARNAPSSFENSPEEKYKEAALLAAQDKKTEAEELFVRTFGSDGKILKPW